MIVVTICCAVMIIVTICCACGLTTRQAVQHTTSSSLGEVFVPSVLVNLLNTESKAVADSGDSKE